MSNKLSTPVAVTLLVLGLLFVVPALTRGIISGMANNSQKDYTGLVISKENYTNNCMGGVDADTMATVGEEKATNYCGCTYDKGIELYGGEEFTKKLMELETSGNFTEEMNGIVNQCAVELQ